mmetsp:Transcript_39930/g.96105  ORF Transcript_39930/g.96105 Transcript_39930/m.96105 type:complete len:205 (-) Transcript_39930:924-1538(-)
MVSDRGRESTFLSYDSLVSSPSSFAADVRKSMVSDRLRPLGLMRGLFLDSKKSMVSDRVRGLNRGLLLDALTLFVPNMCSTFLASDKLAPSPSFASESLISGSKMDSAGRSRSLLSWVDSMAARNESMVLLRGLALCTKHVTDDDIASSSKGGRVSDLEREFTIAASWEGSKSLFLKSARPFFWWRFRTGPSDVFLLACKGVLP